MGYAFISYSTKNQSAADAMHELLKSEGIETWMAPGDIPAGSKYAKVINRAVKDCACFILMLSDDAQNSVWVSKEVERAVNYRKPIIPVQIEDVVLNDEFELYISTDQVVAVRKIDKDTQEIKSLLLSVNNLVGKTDDTAEPKSANSQQQKSKAKNIELTVWSPVNTDVFLNDKNHLVMRIDHNSGFDYKFNSINVSGTFDLIFVANGFEKTISFDADSIESRLEYRLQAILSKKEIRDSYSREEAIEQIETEPTAYAFEQLSEKGTNEDVDLLISILKNLTDNNNTDGQHDNYLIATCSRALGTLAIKYKRLDDVIFVLDIYEKYEAKKSYGWMFDSIVKVLKKTHSETGDKAIVDRTVLRVQNNKEIVDSRLESIQINDSQYLNVTFCDSSLGSIYRAFDPENNIEVAIKIYSPEVAFHIPFFADGGLFWDIKKLQADNLCPFIDRRLSEPTCLIMRYVQGESLEAHIKSAWLWDDNVESILRFSLGILNGLNALHNINIYYGDLTPRNIIIDENNVPWLCDFSESNYNGSRYIDKTVLIEKYRSPEKSPGKNIDYRSDIYEFGVILSDFLPFIRHDDCTRDALFEVVKKATKENPDERFQSVNEIIEKLTDLLNCSPVNTHDETVITDKDDKASFEKFDIEIQSGDGFNISEADISDDSTTPSSPEADDLDDEEQTVEPKLNGHLVNSYRRIQEITVDECVSPIEIKMPDGSVRNVDYCDTFAISPQKKYLIARQRENDEYIFFVFRSRNNKITLVTEGKDQQKVYQLFREKYAENYIFTDEIQIVQTRKNQKKKKYFAQDTAFKFYPTLDSLPQILTVPDKYSYVQPNVFAKLNPNGYRIRQIIIPNTIEKICDNAFDGLIITEMLYIPNSVRSIGNQAFTFDTNAIVFCNENSYAYKYFLREGNVKIVRDIPFEPHGSTASNILAELVHTRNATRLKDHMVPFSLDTEVDNITIPDNIIVIEEYALYYAQVRNKIIIPSSVKKIGRAAFNLGQNAYVECELDSYAYLYCKANKIKNSVDMAREFKAKGLCAYCGGKFTGIFNKKCCVCGKPKDY